MTHPYYVIGKLHYKNRVFVLIESTPLQESSLLRSRHLGVKKVTKQPYSVDKKNELFIYALYFVETEARRHLICGGDDSDELVLGLYHEATYYKKNLPHLNVRMRSLYKIIGNDLSGLLVYGPLFDSDNIKLKTFPDIIAADVYHTFKTRNTRYREISRLKEQINRGQPAEKETKKKSSGNDIPGLDDFPF